MEILASFNNVIVDLHPEGKGVEFGPGEFSNGRKVQAVYRSDEDVKYDNRNAKIE